MVSFQRVFEWPDHPGAGFAFDCNQAGEPSPELCETAQGSLAACLTGVVDGKPINDLGVVRREHSYTEPALGKCACGATVVLDRFTCTCHACGRDYNSAGQELAPRSQWGEETGESVADILAVDSDRGDDWGDDY